MQARRWLLSLTRPALVAGPLAALVLSSGAQASQSTLPGANGPILFVSTRDGNPEIYRMNPDGSQQSRLTSHPANDVLPTANRGGSRILFTSNRDGNTDVYAMNADGSGVTRLTDHPAIDAWAVFSPDGRRIAFASAREGNALRIFLMNADGSGLTRITDGPGADFEPAWAPSGNAIAFTSTRNGTRDVYQVRPDGTSLARLTENPADDFGPDYSPDEKQLMFSSNRGGPFEIYVLDLPAGVPARLGRAAADDNPRKVTDRPDKRKSHGRFSPDGKRMVFEGQPAGRGDFQVIWKPIDGAQEQATAGASNHQPWWVTEEPPCTCQSLTVKILPTLLKNNRLQPKRHDFGIRFAWTIRCTKGKGGCTGVIGVSSLEVFVDKIKQPAGALKIAAASQQFACGGNCGGTSTQRFTVRMRSRDQLTKLIGQEFAFRVVTFCSGAQTAYRVHVLVDRQGRMKASVKKVPRGK